MSVRTSFTPPRSSASPPPSSHSTASVILADLLRERAAIEPIRVAVPHLWALLDAEIARLTAATADAVHAIPTISSLAAGLTRSHTAPVYASKRDPATSAAVAAAAAAAQPSVLSPAANVVRKRVKIPVPAEKYPEYNFVGRLLGPRGTTLKTLERDTGCKIMIRGKGSIRKDKEPDVRGKPGWEHVFNEALHVVIEVGDALDEVAASVALQRAKEAVEMLLVPVPEERDSLKRQQLRALAIMNGTYRGGNPGRGLDGCLGSLGFASSPPPQPLPYPLESPASALYLNDSVTAAGLSHQLLPMFDNGAHEEAPILRRVQSSYGRYEGGVFEEKIPNPQGGGRLTPSSGGTSPKPAGYEAGTGKDLNGLTLKMQGCAVDEFASSSVGDDSPESSHSSEDGEPSAQIIGGGYAGAQVKVSAATTESRAETAVGVGGFLGKEFYNGAFSNGPPSASWEHPNASPQFSSGLYGLSPIPSPQVLTTSTTTVTPIERQDGY
eukprot:GFKZ01003373.1.p1 GENE.GFKZ01003373.1~~GFKZ01003373.1.p1  ORF type:complete len:495 (+),score=58.58 GFKZ01003373.1:507-1991(+)